MGSGFVPMPLRRVSVIPPGPIARPARSPAGSGAGRSGQAGPVVKVERHQFPPRRLRLARPLGRNQPDLDEDIPIIVVEIDGRRVIQVQ
jgi:hypothetical protein